MKKIRRRSIINVLMLCIIIGSVFAFEACNTAKNNDSDNAGIKTEAGQADKEGTEVNAAQADQQGTEADAAQTDQDSKETVEAKADSEKSPLYSASNGNDGNFTSSWCAKDAGSGHWWEVDLGEVTEITGVKINFTKKANYLYIIEVSDDGDTWRTAVNCTGYTEELKMKEDIFNEKARYVRIIYSGLPDGIWASHIDFMVFGK
jgi:hypothetical protein